MFYGGPGIGPRFVKSSYRAGICSLADSIHGQSLSFYGIGDNCDIRITWKPAVLYPFGSLVIVGFSETKRADGDKPDSKLGVMKWKKWRQIRQLTFMRRIPKDSRNLEKLTQRRKGE